MRPGERDQSHPRHLVMVTLVIVTTTRAGGARVMVMPETGRGFGYHI